jgi:long-chain acyl-CoA synthetase
MPGNIAQYFSRHLTRPTHALFRHHVDGAWRDVTVDVTVEEVATRVRRWQAAFRRDGFVAGGRAAIGARNRVNWVAIDIAALGRGLVVVPLYVDDNADSVAWCVGNAEARLLVVENSRLAAAFAKCADPAQPLPPLVVLRPADGEPAAMPATFLPEAAAELTVAELADDVLATICFTSGTSVRPKGVMLSHGDIIANVGQWRRPAWRGAGPIACAHLHRVRACDAAGLRHDGSVAGIFGEPR